MKQDNITAQGTNIGPQDTQDGSVQPLFDVGDNHGNNCYQKQPSDELPHFEAQGDIQGRPDDKSVSCDTVHSDQEEEFCSCGGNKENDDHHISSPNTPTYSVPSQPAGNAPNTPPYSAPSHSAGSAPINPPYSAPPPPSQPAGNALNTPPYNAPPSQSPGNAPSTPPYSAPSQPAGNVPPSSAANNLNTGYYGSVDPNIGNQAPSYAGQSKPFISQNTPQYPPHSMPEFHQYPPFYAFNPSNRPGAYQAPPAFSQSHYPHGFPGQFDDQKVPKHDENKYGKMVEVVNGVLEGNPDIPKMVELIEGWDQSFWKGAAVGAGLTLLFTSSTVKTAITNLLSGGTTEEAKK